MRVHENKRNKIDKILELYTHNVNMGNTDTLPKPCPFYCI